MRAVALAVLALTAGASPTVAADGVRLSLGLGEGTAGGPAVGASLACPMGAHLVSVRGTFEIEFLVWDWEQAWEAHGDLATPARRNWDVAVLYGRTARSGRVWLSAAAGIAVAGGVRRGELLYHERRRGPVHERLDPRGVGLPIEVQAIFEIPGSELGVGLLGYAEVSRGASFAGLLLVVQGRSEGRQ